MIKTEHNIAYDIYISLKLKFEIVIYQFNIKIWMNVLEVKNKLEGISKKFTIMQCLLSSIIFCHIS